MDDYYTPDFSPSMVQVNGDLWAVELAYTGPALEPGETIPSGDGLKFGVQYTDWSDFDKSNDFSQPYGNGYSMTDNIAIYNSNNELVIGTEPEQGTYAISIRSPWGGQMLTATDKTIPEGGIMVMSQNENQSWNTQDWIIQPIDGTNRVRILNAGNGQYLTVKDPNEEAKVVCQPLDTTWSSQEWTIQPVPGENTVRLKNAYGGRYLTVENSGDWQKIKSQYLRSGWISQKWIIE